MDSRNHAMYSTPSFFLFASVAGLRPVVGDRLWRVAPAVVGASREVTSASAKVWTVKGPLRGGWALLDSAPWRLRVNASVPVGLTALVSLPLSPGARTTTGCTVSLGAATVWGAGGYVPGSIGIVAGSNATNMGGGPAVTLRVGSGVFDLLLSC